MMQQHPTPGPLEKNLLEVEAQTGVIELYNAILDKAGAIHKRPGLFLNQVLPAAGPVQAIYYWPSRGKLVVVAGGSIWAAENAATTLAKVNNPVHVLADGKVTIADTGRWLFFASSGGGKMMTWDGTNTAEYVSDGAAPTNVTTVTVLNQRVIANSLGTNQFWYTDPPPLATPDDPLSWAGYLEVGKTKEEIIGLSVANGELIAFKRDMLQAFFDDGVTPYKPILGSQQFYGLVSPTAVCQYKNHLFFVTPDNSIRLLANREITDVSTQMMGRELKKIKNAATVIAFRLDEFVCFKFVEENKFFVYDPVLKSWSQFTTFQNGIDKAFIAQDATTLPTAGETNSWLIAGTDGKTYFWDYSSYQDFDNPIRVKIRTPHHDWQTSRRKTTTKLVAKVATEPVKDLIIPDISWPDCERCQIYSHSITLPDGVFVTLTGLPAGFTATQVGNVLTIQGSTADYTGSSNVTVLITDKRGASYMLTKAFVVTDFDIEIGVL